MTNMPFAPDTKITTILKSSAFTFSAEVIPPRNGASQSDILGQIANLVEAGAQFLAVTKGAGGSLRGGSLPIVQLIKERFRTPCIAHFTCRDLVPAEVENQLVDHHLFGVRNILALRGDPPTGQPEWMGREGSHNYAHQLIEQITALNSGKYLERAGFKPGSTRESTDFCIGAAAYPDHPDVEERIRFFRMKIDAGATYGISQMLFCPNSYEDFLERCARVGASVPVLPGTRILKSQKQALRMAERFQVQMPKSFLNSLPAEDGAPTEQIIEPFLKLSERFKAVGAPGIHIFVLTDTLLACEALRVLKS